jgi:hypothetical protein
VLTLTSPPITLGLLWRPSYPVHGQIMQVSIIVAPALRAGATMSEVQAYGRTPKLAPHIWLSKTVPLEYLDSVQVVSCGRGLSVGNAPLPG